LANHHRHAQAARHQQGFVTEIAGRSAGFDNRHSFCLPPVAARQDVESDPAGLQQLAQQNDKRSFSRASYGKIADADGDSLEAADWKRTTIVEEITRAYAGAKHRGERIHT